MAQIAASAASDMLLASHILVFDTKAGSQTKCWSMAQIVVSAADDGPAQPTATRSSRGSFGGSPVTPKIASVD